MRAIELYIKYEKSPADVIRELGYPDRKMLGKWYKMYLEKQETGVPYEKKVCEGPQLLAGRTRGGSPPLPQAWTKFFKEPSGPWDIPTGRHSGCGAKTLCPTGAGNAATS